MSRKVPANTLALRYALECTIPSLKRAALAHVKAVIRAEHGSTTRIVEKLGISVSTYMRWLDALPAVRDTHHRNRPKNQPGTKPQALSDK